MSVECIHIRDSRPGDYYCGRASSFKKSSKLYDCSILGNPFSSPTLTRDESIANYKEYIWEKFRCDYVIHEAIDLLANEAFTKDIRLVCFCKPKACHTDIIKEIIDEQINKC